MDQKRKRGRPPLIPAEQAVMWGSLYHDIHSARQRQARWLAMCAINILGLRPIGHSEFPPPTWLVDWAGANRGEQGAIKWGVLEQLGRMSRAGVPDEVIREYATALGSAGLSAKEAEWRLRMVRLKPDVMRLAVAGSRDGTTEDDG